MRRDRLPAVAEADRLAPEPCLEPDQADRREGRPQDRPAVAVVADGEDRERQDLEADDDRDGPVDPFDPGLRVAERRDELAVAQRPVGAAEAGIGGADDDPDRDQPESGREGQRGELLEAVHEAPILPGRRLPAARDTLSAMTPRRWLPLLVLLALVAAACGSERPVRGAVRGGRLGPAGDAPEADAGPRHERHRQGQGADPVPLSRLEERRRERPGPDRQGRLLRPRDRPRQAGHDRRRRVRLDDRERARHVRRQRRLPDGGHVGRRIHDRGAELAARDRPARRSTSANRRRPIKIGAKAPASKTPTAADVGGDLTKISTDTNPDPAFYKTSVADALAAHKPFMLVFATPKFCTSKQCGPTLDQFKPIAEANPDVTFINVEPYQLKVVDGALQPVLDANDQLQATDITNEWGLLSEPWIFAVDRERRRPGLVRGDDHARRSSRRSCRSSRPAADPTLGRVLEPDRDPRHRPRSDTRPGPAAPSTGARRGGRAGTRRRSRGRRA